MLTTLIVTFSFAVIVSAFCSLTEAALYSIPASQIELMATRHPNRAARLKKLKATIERPITAILTLNTLANTLGAAISGVAAAAVFGESNLIWFSLFFTLIILLFSEIIPKTIGVAYNRNIMPYLATPLYWMVFILQPVIWFIQFVIRLVPRGEGTGQISAEEIRAAAMLSRKAGLIAKDQEKVISNILELDNKVVRQVMTPRTVVFMLEKTMTVSEAAKLKDKWRMHSRVPLYDGDVDEIVGIVLSRDVFLSASESGQRQLCQIMQPVHFIPETAPLNRIFLDFFERRQHLFVAVDEYGSVTGVISMEDIIEEIVGREIVDESDRAGDMRELARSRNKETRLADAP